MATSFVLTKTANDLVEEALRDARIIPSEQPIQSIDYEKGETALNNVVKYWQTQGIHLWRLKRAVLPLIKDQKTYSLGPSAAKCAIEDEFYNTTLSADEASGQTQLSVSSTDNMSAADNIGIELDDGTRQWTTIASTGSGTVTVDDALTGDASSGNTVFYYTTNIQRPLEIFNVTYQSNINASEIPVEVWARDEYMEQTDKTSRGTVVGAYYIPTTTNGTLYVWQVANSVKNILRFDYREPLVIYGATSDTIDVPEEYLLPLKWAVAAEVGPQYGVPQTRQQLIEQKAFSTLENALANDAEEGSMFIRPDFT